MDCAHIFLRNAGVANRWTMVEHTRFTAKYGLNMKLVYFMALKFSPPVPVAL